eukprot:TRINITY_DN9878_c0_g1_i10.p1 TRINITY_DN9878_c0_g1~~TRINITY_DN9878_c0_g1_i10.p1  ORF type:complete len:193 (-),score=61.17 TRINITY_DN9878_c0_g1_i10:165-743(-)
MIPKKILLVCANPNPKSFSHAILNTAVQAFKDKKYETLVRDLYAMKFDPIMRKEEIGISSLKDLPQEIQKEQEHVKWCDIITFIGPMWWYGMPAMMKGYFDRVFVRGFAHDIVEGRSKGLLDKGMVVFQPMGAGEDRMKEKLLPAINTVADSWYRFCGMKPLGFHYFPSMPWATEKMLEGYLDQVKEACSKL